MSGHSKWASIKRSKGAADVKRGATFTKLANAITVAARQGGGGAESNFKLRLAIEKARQANMPKDNMERAIKRGTGELGGAKIEDIIYEAYGPGGIALMIEAASDNRNRTTAEVKSILNKYGGKLAGSGAVTYQFKQRGVISLEVGDKSIEEAELAVIDAGAQDFEEQAGIILVYSEPKETERVRSVLETSGLKATDTALSWEPTTTIEISDEKVAKQVLRLTESLESLDDVTAVSGNFDIPAVLLDKMAAEI